MGREIKKERARERPQTLVLLRKRLLRSQSVASADVQAGGSKALAGSSTHKKKIAQRLDSLIARDLVHHKRFSEWGAHARPASLNKTQWCTPFQQRLGRDRTLMHTIVAAVHHRGAHHDAWVALAVLVNAHLDRDLPFVQLFREPDHPNWVVLRGFLVLPTEEFSRQRTPRA